MHDLPLTAAGREIPHALDRIRRYCGLRWSGGARETWAWPYFDAVPTEHDDAVGPVDVVCAAALHPGLSRADLAFFRERAADVTAWLAPLPSGPRLWEVPVEVVDHLATLPAAFPHITPTLLSKVLHRKRPHLIPLLDRHVIDWYRPVTGKRAAVEAWETLVRTMRDEELDSERRVLTSIAVGTIEAELWPDVDGDDRPHLSWLRAVDIAIWMAGR